MSIFKPKNPPPTEAKHRLALGVLGLDARGIPAIIAAVLITVTIGSVLVLAPTAVVTVIQTWLGHGG